MHVDCFLSENFDIYILIHMCDSTGFLYPKVMASKRKIYIVLEFVDGGELFDKIVRKTVVCALAVLRGNFLVCLFVTN